VNREHLELCSSEGWKDVLRDFVVPYALAGASLGDDVLEVGPGPGMTTDLLRAELPKLTCVELDPALADALASRLHGTNVEVVEADATSMPFDDNRFTGAVSFRMLHHVPTLELDDEEVLRAATRDGRTLVTENACDFDPIARAWAASGQHHRGSKAYPGNLIRALSSLLSESPRSTRGWLHWLE